MKLRASHIILWLCLVLASARADIGVGDRREDVLRIVGKPASSARRGNHEIFQYPKGGRIEFVDGRVVEVKGPLPTAAVSASAATTASPAPTVAPVAAPPIAPAVAAPAPPKPVAAAPATAAPPAHASQPQPDRADFEREEDESPPSLAAAIGLLAVMLVAQFGLTFGALKIAFHYQQMDALWSGILAITGIDVGLQLVMSIVTFFQSGELRLGIAGTGLPGLAMIWTIRKFCLDQRWKRAIATTSAVKIAAILLTVGLLSLGRAVLA